MNNKLQTIEKDNQRVLTTQILAESYGTEAIKIQQNFHNNKERYTLGKHYFLLTGEELRKFKGNLENFEVATNSNKLYLWTEKGALLHAKSLNTDKAWEVYDMLVENYFRVKKIENPYAGLSPELQSIFAIDKKQQETEKKVNSLEKEFIEFKNETPLFNIECEELTKATKKKGIEILGGYNSPAYKDKSLRGKVYADIHAEIKRNFGVKSYKAIKRSQLDKAYLIIQEHKAPLCLSDEIQAINNQMSYL